MILSVFKSNLCKCKCWLITEVKLGLDILGSSFFFHIFFVLLALLIFAESIWLPCLDVLALIW